MRVAAGQPEPPAVKRIDTGGGRGRLGFVSVTGRRMNETEPALRTGETADGRRRLDLARAAYKEFYAQCFWSYREDAEITEDKIPFVIRGLREHGGLAGYKKLGP
jgi:hypothetical protein